MKKITLFLLLFTFLVNAQDNVQAELDSLQNVYENLEYNTIAFNDLKNKWFINDPGFVRELFNKFAVKNAFRVDGQSVDLQTVMQKANEVFDGDVIVDLRRRYYDEEFDYFAFVSIKEANKVKPKPLFDPIVDGFYLKEIIGTRLYDKIKEKSYFFSDVTKDAFESEYGYYFDVNLDLLEPEIMFWSTTSSIRDKYLLSFKGKWGYDQIMLPGWYSAEYIAGMQLTYYKAVGEDPLDYTYRIFLGTGMDVSKPFVKELPDLPIYRNGETIYGNISGDVLKFLWDELEGYYLNFEMLTQYTDYQYKDYGITDVDAKFNGVKNFMCLSVDKRKLFNLYDFGQFKVGAGLATHDLYRYEISQATRSVIDLEEGRDELDLFQHYGYIKFGVENNGGLIQHDINVLVGMNSLDTYLYSGLDAKFMISNTFGFHVKALSAFGVPDYRTWRNSSYVVFSPVLRINY